MRTLSGDFLTKLPFDGHAIGGSLGKTKEQMVEMLTYVMPQLPEDKPTHLLGIGDTQSLEQCIVLGLDTFDSSYPTKCARHGLILTFDGHKKVTHSADKEYFVLLMNIASVLPANIILWPICIICLKRKG